MRRSNAWHATREAQAAWQLHSSFEALFQAAAAWRDGGDFDAMEIALDALSESPEYTGFPPLDKQMPRDKRISALAARYVSVSQLTNRMRETADKIDAVRRKIGDELRLTIAERNDVPEYAQLLLKGLQAEGIRQPDLHPPSRALARVVAEAIRDYNAGRRNPKGEDAPNDYSDRPVSEWVSLPRSFGGVELVDVQLKEDQWAEPFPLPPATDMAAFMPDRKRPELGPDRRQTIIAWSHLIGQWAGRTGKTVPGMQAATWALLLAHHMPWDESDLSRLHGLVLESPWKRGGVVRIDVLSEPPDDVPW